MVANYQTITVGTTTAKAFNTTKTFNHTVGSGANRMLIVCAMVRDDAVTGVTYGGTAMTQIGDSSTYDATIWALANPAVGTAQVAITTDGTDPLGAGAITLFGVAQVGYVDDVDNSGSHSGSGTVSTTVTATVGGGIAIQAVIHQDNSTGTFGSGQTSVQNSADTDGSACSYKRYSLSGNVTMSYTVGDTSVQSVVALKPAMRNGGAFLYRMI